MATVSEKLAQSLEILHDLQAKGHVAIHASALSRLHKERLLRNGFLEEVMKGWYIPTRPDEVTGESTAWYTSFWHFCAEYLTHRFDNAWNLSPEDSLKLHAGNKTVPVQLLVRSPNARNQVTHLPHNTSLMEVRAGLAKNENVFINEDGLRLFSLPIALTQCSPNFFRQHPTDARTALAMIQDSSEVLTPLLERGQSTVASRLVGAFRNIGRTRTADEILETMRAAGYNIQEIDPFNTPSPVIISSRERSPYINRIRLMWEVMRQPIIDVFPASPGLPPDVDAYMNKVSETYVLDAYNSLSIEGYRVSPELIERVRSGKWNPNEDEEDRNHRNALAARGYWQAFQVVQESIEEILRGNNAGKVTDHDHGTWYRELFAPSITAGILQAKDLAGYRNGPVYIRRSMHVPLNPEAVRDLMPFLFELISKEEHAGVRVVLGHFIFVYIHPYIDGNGRIARFLMNAMLASGGFPWTIVPLAERATYMAALEEASTRQNIKPFAEFLARLVQDSLNGNGPELLKK